MAIGMWKARINHQDLEGAWIVRKAYISSRIVVQGVSQYSLDISNPSTNGDRPSLGSETVGVGKQSGANPSGSALELQVCSVACSFKRPIGRETYSKFQ